MKYIFVWIKRILAGENKQILSVIIGISLTIAILSSMGIFLYSATSDMTKHAVSSIPVDYQVLLKSDVKVKDIKAAIEKKIGISKSSKVYYADAAGFVSQNKNTMHITGKGKVLGIDKRFIDKFHKEIRFLVGSKKGVLIAQQAAANLHVKPGDIITIKRINLPPVNLKISGIIDLPFADSMFQDIGIKKSLQAQSPPDNVLVIPIHQWHKFFDKQEKIRPDTIKKELYVSLKHSSLPNSPKNAYIFTSRLANNIESIMAGKVAVGNNIANSLSAAKTDGSYASVIFLFLGLPAFLLSLFLTISVMSSSKRRHMKQWFILKFRGYSPLDILRIELYEAVIVTFGSLILGIALSYALGAFFKEFNHTFLFIVIYSSAFVLLFMLIFTFYSYWHKIKNITTMNLNQTDKNMSTALWKKVYLDFILLAISFIAYFYMSKNGYQIVLSPEGSPQVSVHYEAFIAPLFLWLGGILLFARLLDYILVHSQDFLSSIFKPITGNLSKIVLSYISRNSKPIIFSSVMIALSFSFAVSTAIFNTTYNAQSKVDAELTNGADVTVSSFSLHPLDKRLLEKVKTIREVSNAQPMIHRYAYIGNELQDIYGINPLQIIKATNMSNVYFANNNAEKTLRMLKKTPDGILVSEETKKDYQLNIGDTLNLRIQSAKDSKYHTVAFKFIGVVREFPTAPKDSFLVANYDYIAQKTGNVKYETLLIKTTKPEIVTKKVKKIITNYPGAIVSDINSVQKSISSNLTAVNLHNLTKLELFFGILFTTAFIILMFALNLKDRKRNFAILDVIGAKHKQFNGFIFSEGLIVFFSGMIAGSVLGFGVAYMLVKLLKGAFDPPPAHLFVPWSYVGILFILAFASFVFVVTVMSKTLHKDTISEIRKL
jgi:putative ABC transport system permease protein